jgi:hypothetical protein
MERLVHEQDSRFQVDTDRGKKVDCINIRLYSAGTLAEDKYTVISLGLDPTTWNPAEYGPVHGVTLTDSNEFSGDRIFIRDVLESNVLRDVQRRFDLCFRGATYDDLEKQEAFHVRLVILPGWWACGPHSPNGPHSWLEDKRCDFDNELM